MTRRSRVYPALFAILGVFAAACAILIIHRLTTAPAAPSKPTAQKAPGPTPEQCLAKLPLTFLSGQVLMIGLKSEDMSAQAPMFTQYNIGGAAIMTSPPDPQDGSIKSFKAAAASFGIRPLIATDEEGGSVQRFATIETSPSQADAAATMSPDQAQNLIAQHGKKLQSIGIDMIFGPVADVGPVDGPSVLGDRVFSNDPATVTAYSSAYVEGWHAAGLLPTMKHFPGMGSASANTDFATAVTPPLNVLEQRDFVPYRHAAQSTAIMTGNQNVPGWFDGPASLSPVVNTYLREKLGYKNNLIVTDSLSAEAVTAATPAAQAMADAIAAGNDIALYVEPPSSTADDTQQLVARAKALIESSVQSGSLPKQQLIASVLRKLNAQHVQACTIRPPQ